MKTILLKNPISFKDLKVRHSIEKYTFVNGCIGYNDEVYFLFSEHVPERIKGMFVDTQERSNHDEKRFSEKRGTAIKIKGCDR